MRLEAAKINTDIAKPAGHKYWCVTHLRAALARIFLRFIEAHQWNHMDILG